jgi:putative transposase
MANTYTQIHIQVVFTVRDKECIISSLWKDELYKYITGIVQNNGHKLLAINGMPDHLHILLGLRPKQSLSDLLQDIKGGSSKWINEKRFVRGRFSWQEGYGAFSYSYNDIQKVIDYIRNQEEHHKGKSFLEEYNAFLEENDIGFEEQYIFKPV